MEQVTLCDHRLITEFNR